MSHRSLVVPSASLPSAKRGAGGQVRLG